MLEEKIMRLFAVAGFALVASMAVAFADDDPMASRYGNTVVVKMQNNGPVIHMYYNADHTFTGNVISMNYKLKGTWKMEGANICLVYDPLPPGQKNPTCNLFEQHAIGDTWTADGRTISLVPGVQ
jgi:hypothetical protein